MSTLLLEIGTEELPADFARLVLPQLELLVIHDLQQRRLSHDKVCCYGTPRRIVLLVDGLSDSAIDLKKNAKVHQQLKPLKMVLRQQPHLALPKDVAWRLTL